MKTKIKSSSKPFLKVVSIVCWITLLLQFILILQNRVADISETIIRYFSFFTIQSNILVGLSITSLAWKNNSRFNDFFTNNNTITAISIYISIVAIVYNTVLRFIGELHGLQMVVDTMLHAIIPVIFVIYWFKNCTNFDIKWSYCFMWSIFPIVYLIYTLIRGSFVNFYPYPFLDVNKIGLKAVLFNSLLVALVFFLFSIIVTYIIKSKNK